MEFFKKFHPSYWMPELASAHGHQIDNLIVWIHILMYVLFIGWSIYFIIALIKFRQSKNPKADHIGAKTHVSTYLEIGVAMFEAVLLIGFSIPFWANVVNAVPSGDDVLKIDVIGEQFAWNFHYTGPDGKFGRKDIKFVVPGVNGLGIDPDDPNGKDDIFTVNELVVPIDQTIVMNVSAKDVIHSFFLPQMRVKQDAIPGMVAPLSFKAIKTGKWDIACAQLCGSGHYGMKGEYSVVTAEEYQAWMQNKINEASGVGGDDEF